MGPALKQAKGTPFDISAKDVWDTSLKKEKWPRSNVPVLYMPGQNLDMRIFIKKPPLSLSGSGKRLTVPSTAPKPFLPFFVMDERKAVWVQWLSLFGNMLGTPDPTDLSDESLKKYFKPLCLLLHPDKHGYSSDQPQGQRLVHFLQILNGVNDKYYKTAQDMEPPDAAYFEMDEEPIDHDCDKPPQMEGKSRSGRRVYLVTFSHSSCPERRAPFEFSRKEFADMLVQAFEASIPNLQVACMVVFQEQHQSGDTDADRNIHFHAAVKSSRQHSWAPIADCLRREHRVYVHFATSGVGYGSAFRYGWHPSKRKPLAELDRDFLLVNGAEEHPAPKEASQRQFWTGRKQRFPFDQEDENSSAADAEEAEEDNEEGLQPKDADKKPRREPVWAYAFRLIRDNNIKTGDAFGALAKRLDDARLLSLCMQKQASSIVERALHLLEAEARLKRSQLSCLDILHQAATLPCCCARPGEWKTMAIDLLRLQKILPVLSF